MQTFPGAPNKDRSSKTVRTKGDDALRKRAAGVTPDVAATRRLKAASVANLPARAVTDRTVPKPPRRSPSTNYIVIGAAATGAGRTETFIVEVQREHAGSLRELLGTLATASSSESIPRLTRLVGKIPALARKIQQGRARKTNTASVAQVKSAVKDSGAPENSWTTLKDEFLREFKSVTPREFAEVTGSKARNTASRAHDWTKAGRIFGLHDGHGLRYPLFQIKEGRPVREVAEVLRALRSREFSDWEIAVWFSTPNAELGDWETPASALSHDPRGVARAAENKAEEPVY